MEMKVKVEVVVKDEVNVKKVVEEVVEMDEEDRIGGGSSCGHESEVNVEKVLEKEKVEKDKGEVKEKMNMATNRR